MLIEMYLLVFVFLLIGTVVCCYERKNLILKIVVFILSLLFMLGSFSIEKTECGDASYCNYTEEFYSTPQCADTLTFVNYSTCDVVVECETFYYADNGLIMFGLGLMAFAVLDIYDYYTHTLENFGIF